MPTRTLYQVDAFTDELFGGNPAAVLPLPAGPWPNDAYLQNIAAENNLAETAYFRPRPDGDFDLRWFTPTVEVRFCGHATLASAHVLFAHRDYERDEIRFHTKELGVFTVRRAPGGFYTMNFPADELQRALPVPGLQEGIDQRVLECWRGRDDYFLVLQNEAAVRDCQPDFRTLATVKARGVVITAPGDAVDFVCRGFFPQSGIDEDPVTGSANTSLTSLWSEKLGKTELTAQQLSQRVGNLRCRDLGERVEVSGRAVTYMIGELV